MVVSLRRFLASFIFSPIRSRSLLCFGKTICFFVVISNQCLLLHTNVCVLIEITNKFVTIVIAKLKRYLVIRLFSLNTSPFSLRHQLAYLKTPVPVLNTSPLKARQNGSPCCKCQVFCAENLTFVVFKPQTTSDLRFFFGSITGVLNHSKHL